MGNRFFAKIEIAPWNGLQVNGRQIPEPRGKLKRQIVSGLLDIADAWERQLQMLEAPYSLQLWLFEPRFSHSQVVCAIGERVNFYQRTFSRAKSAQSPNFSMYHFDYHDVSKFTWSLGFDEEYYHIDNIGDTDFAEDEFYSVRFGYVWIGERRRKKIEKT